MQSIVRHALATCAFTAAILASPVTLGAQAAPNDTLLRIDPLLVATVKEYRNIIRTVGAEIFPGWDASTVPILLYRPQVQDVLIGPSRVPKGFVAYRGRPLLPGEKIFIRNDSTVMSIDDQNTSINLDSMRVLVVADQFSSFRNKLRDMFQRPPEVQRKWLDDWSFVPSPYSDVLTMLHESFHVHQDRLAADKGAVESTVAQYPVLDVQNNALVALEGLVLRDALLATDPAVQRSKTEEFVAARRARRASLDSASIAYEDLNEFAEGLATYVEFRFMQLGGRVTPVAEMYYRTGFHGYQTALREEFVRRMEDLVKITGNTDDRFRNKYGAGPLRFRLYATGGAQGLLLDQVDPRWKTKVFGKGVYLTALLTDGLHLSSEQERAALTRAKTEYGHDRIVAEKEEFAKEGHRRIQAQVDAILQTKQTLVTIQYGPEDIAGMGFTPFGVTAVNAQSAIYDMVPVAMRFANKVVLRMKVVAPLLVDRAKHTVTFAVATGPDALVSAANSAMDVAEFSLTASPNTRVAAEGNHVTISLK